MFPHNSKHTLLFSSAVESFGVCAIQPTPKKVTTTSSSSKVDAAAKKKATSVLTPTKKKSTVSSGQKRSLTLTDLPFEMLEKIFHFLDSFRWLKTIFFKVFLQH